MPVKVGKSGSGSGSIGPQVEGIHRNQANVGSEAPVGWPAPEAPDGTRVRAKGHKGKNYEGSDSGDKVGM